MASTLLCVYSESLRYSLITDRESLTSVCRVFQLIQHGYGIIFHRNLALTIGACQQLVGAESKLSDTFAWRKKLCWPVFVFLRSFIAYTGVKPTVNNIHSQIGPNQQYGVNQRYPSNNGVITIANTRHKMSTHARNNKDLFDYEGARHHISAIVTEKVTVSN